MEIEVVFFLDDGEVKGNDGGLRGIGDRGKPSGETTVESGRFQSRLWEFVEKRFSMTVKRRKTIGKPGKF